MISKSEFMRVASCVSDSYEDFILGTYIEAKSEGFLEEVYNFMKNNDNLSTDDVCVFLNYLEGDPEPIRVGSPMRLHVA